MYESDDGVYAPNYRVLYKINDPTGRHSYRYRYYGDIQAAKVGAVKLAMAYHTPIKIECNHENKWLWVVVKHYGEDE